jgi:hypothetical protein
VQPVIDIDKETMIMSEIATAIFFVIRFTSIDIVF